MKRVRIVIVVLALGLAVVFAWWLIHRRLGESESHGDGTVANQKPEATSVEAAEGKLEADRRREQERRNLNPALWWTTPISFYGRTVDQSGQPVALADVRFEVNDTSARGTTDFHAKSDANGFFSLTNVKGANLAMHITKNGYYQGHAEKNSFSYAGADSIYEPDPKNPTVFHLHKGGERVPLIKRDWNLQIKLNAPIIIDLLNDTTNSPTGQLQIELLENDPGGRNAFGAKCLMRLSVAGGGIRTNAEEFPFIAPESGYESSVEIGTEFGTSRPGWGTTTARAVFLKMQGLYARAQIELNPGGTQFLVDYYINPTGSRNLEPDATLLFDDLESYNLYIAAHPQAAK